MRASAAYVFGEINSKDSIPYLMKTLEDKVWFVVKNGIKSLVKKGNEVLPFVVSSLNSSEKTLVINCLTILYELSIRESIESIIPLLYNEDGDIREKAQETIDGIREKTKVKN
jgi:HEAT repeat protein